MYLNTEIATPYVHVANAPFRTSGVHQATIEDIIEVYRYRQDMVKARTKLILQAQASLRRLFDGDKEKAAKAFGEASKDVLHEHRKYVDIYVQALDLLEKQQGDFEKQLVKSVKRLPVYKFAKETKGFGDIALACIIGECSGANNKTGEFYTLGDFKSVSAVWKRMGLAVVSGERQRKNAGEEAKLHGYSPTRRSVMWNIGNSIILGMGKFRPMFGEDVNANEEYTYLQRVFAERARYEALLNCPKLVETKKDSGIFVPKLDANGEIIRIELNEKTGKESYSKHAANRAKRYTEKRLLRMLYAEWRKCMG